MGRLNIIDFHCDALYKMWGKRASQFSDDKRLDTNKNYLKQGGVKVQCFAIYVLPQMKLEQKYEAALNQVHYFYEEILRKNPEMKQIKNWSDFDTLQEHEIGAMLTIEGIDPIGNDLQKLQFFYDLGVRAVGLTWNHANLAADGALEPRNAGLTEFGREIIQFHNERKIITDVSHLGERSFWDVLEIADYPLASHSNAKAICDSPRNLTDEQAKALFKKGGMIHTVFYPPFVKEENPTVSDVIKHIEHFCSLGGEKLIGFGSDFDGIEEYVEGLENAGMYPNLINELLKLYSEEQVRGFASENFLRNRPQD